jgi:hypothetical protein
MPLVRLLVPVIVRKEQHGQGETVWVEGREASRLLTEGQAVIVREQPHEKADKSARPTP